MLVGVIACWKMKSGNPTRKIWNHTGLAISVLYVLLGFSAKAYASSVLEEKLAENAFRLGELFRHEMREFMKKK